MCAELGGDGVIRRRLLSELGMEEDEVKEWELIEDITISEPTSSIKVPLSKQYRRMLFVTNNVVSSGTGNLCIMLNTESTSYNARKLAALTNFLTTATYKYTIWEVEFVNKFPVISRGAINSSNLQQNGMVVYSNVSDITPIAVQNYICLISETNGVTMNSGNIKVYGIPE